MIFGIDPHCSTYAELQFVPKTQPIFTRGSAWAAATSVVVALLSRAVTLAGTFWINSAVFAMGSGKGCPPTFRSRAASS